MNLKSIAVASALVLAVTGCSGAAVSSNGPAEATPMSTTVAADPIATPETDPNAVETPISADTPEPESTGPDRVAVGETTTVTSNGDPYLEITVSKPSQHKSYGSGYSVDKPKKGNVFLQVYVTYKSLQDGASYNQFDWDVFVDDNAVDDFTFVIGGPEPSLGSGDLPKGRTAKGWLVYEVPLKGEVLLSYKGSFLNDAPVFEVVIRKA